MKILEILSGPSYDPVIAYKDAGMLLYELNKSFNYMTNYCGCNCSEYNAVWNPQFLKSVCVTKISESLEFKQQVLDIKKYIKALEHQEIKKNYLLCSMSCLKYFHDELNIKTSY